MNDSTAALKNHGCVVCKQKMAENEEVCPQCGRKAHISDYKTDDLEVISSSVIPKLCSILLVFIIMLLIYRLFTGKMTIGETIIPLIVVLFALVVFVALSFTKIFIGKEYFILYDEVAFYSDIIKAEEKKQFDLRRDKRHIIYTQPPNVEEKDINSFTISQITFGFKYKDILNRIERNSS